MLMKKLSEEHYIICDDSEIKKGDWVVSGTKTIVQCMYPENVHHEDIKKITHSTQPLYKNDFWAIQELKLSEVKELLGVVDVEKKAVKCGKEYQHLDGDVLFDHPEYFAGFFDGYNQALEDNNHKKWTDADVIRIVEKSRQTGLTAEYLMLSLQPKTEWEVEIVDGKLKLKQ